MSQTRASKLDPSFAAGLVPPQPGTPRNGAARNIPLVDLRAQYEAIQPEIDGAIRRVVESAAFIGGEEVQAFEREFAEFCGAGSTAGVANGSDALYLALRALGVGPGDEVITVANTFIATVEAITLVGARPVFVDLCADTMLIDPEQVEAAVTPKTKVILPVHLYGQTCQMDALLDIAGRHNVAIVEDAAQAHGATWQGRRAGSFGRLACFSFYPGKNLGAYGDAGAVVGDDESLVRHVAMLANHGRTDKYVHDIEGVSSRLDGLQAAILRVKLRHLDTWNAARRRCAAQYSEALSSLDIVLPVARPQGEPVWHLYVVQVPNRDHVQESLQRQGIECGVHYPIPLHRQPAYAHLGLQPGSLPVTERLADSILSLPMFPEMTAEQVDLVAKAVRRALRS
jgi:dTDP-4-amino-4,6-dideoxygalactose transaminase